MDYIDTGAKFSPCRTWRYALWRTWDHGLPKCVFVLLNPSTADETADDPTQRRCRTFAADWGYGGFITLNLFAFRATFPADMKRAENPVGPHNDRHIRRVVRAAGGSVVCGWGNHGSFMGRSGVVRKLIGDCGIAPVCLQLNKGGEPKHPLYVRRDCKLEPLLR